MTRLALQRMISLSALLAVAACGDDSTSGGGGSGAGSDTGAGGVGGSGASSTGGSSTGGSSTGGSSTGGSGGTGAGTTDGGGGTMLTCTDDAGDSECIACAKDNCCAETTACQADTGCAACLACIDTAADPTDCLGTCDLNDPTTASAYECSNMSCNTECFGGNAALCEPDATDDPCTACAKMNCCDEVEACQASAQCVACLQCVGEAADPFDCVGTGLPCSFSDGATVGLLGCVNGTPGCPVCTEQQ